MLSSRTEKILKYIVGQYITTGIPIPSQDVANGANLKVSPATIRHEMACLEQDGYIVRRYPSGGSIPSDKGYRYYVESLSAIELPVAEQRLIGHLFHQVEGELEKWLSLTATVVARLTQNMAVVTAPKPIGCQFRHLELVSLQESLALVVLVLRGARIKQQLITFDEVLSQSDLMVISNKLNESYAGLTSRQIRAKDVGLLPAEQQVTDIVIKILEIEEEKEWEEPYLDGLHFMFSHPEFARSTQVLSLMELIEHRDLLKAIIPQGLASHRVQVVIGRENKAEAIQDCSVVISQYGLPREALGTIGVIGPTRMPYVSAISAVGHLSLVLSGLVAELYGEGTSGAPGRLNRN